VKKTQEVLSLLQEHVDIIWHTVHKYSWVRVGVIVTVFNNHNVLHNDNCNMA